MSEPLFCVGCGRTVCHTPPPGHTLAISCACGAGSPILHMENGAIWGLPASVVGFLTPIVGAEPPHLELYLGYSAHQSALREKLERQLKEMGCTSQWDCQQPRCKVAYWDGVKKLRDRRDRQLADAMEVFSKAMEELQQTVIEKEGCLPPNWPEGPMVASRKLIAILRGEEEL